MNIVLEKGQVVTTVNGHTSMHDVGNMGACFACSGFCDTGEAMVIWDHRQIVEPCTFVENQKDLPYSVKAADNHFVITTI